MRSFFATLRQLVLPAGAGSGTPRIVIGPDVPPELQAYYNVGLARMTSCITWYYGNATDTYHYYGVVDLGGGVPPGNVVRGDVLSGLVLPADTYVGANWSIWRGFDVLLNSGVVPGADLLIDSVSQPRGLIKNNLGTPIGAIAIPDSGNVAAETAVATATNAVWRNGRVYKLSWTGLTRPAGGSTIALFRVRKNSTAGSSYIGNQVTNTPAVDITARGWGFIMNNSGADVTQTVVLTLTPLGGGTQRIQTIPNDILSTWTIEDYTSVAMLGASPANFAAAIIP